MNKRIVFFIGTLCEGGGERVISILTNKLFEKGIDTDILIYHDADPFYTIPEGVKLVRVEAETGSRSILKNMLWMRKYFKEKASVVISFLAPFNMLALVSCMLLKTPIIVADRNDPQHVPGNILLRKCRDFLYRFADGVVVQTEKNKEYFSAAVQKKSRVIYNPVALGDQRGLALKTEKKKKIVSVGRLMPQKNQKMLIQAFSKIQECLPEYSLVIYGEGPARGDLEKQIRNLGLEASVTLPGSVVNVPECIADAELFVLPSDYEGMPNALIEAMCLGLPVISTRVSGATDLIEGKNGILTDVNNTEELIQGMKCLLQDSEKRRIYGENAAKLNERLQVENILEQWLAFVESVSKKG